ncbi:MAG: thioredoxin family protein [Planctomycetota bacterium]
MLPIPARASFLLTIAAYCVLLAVPTAAQQPAVSAAPAAEVPGGEATDWLRGSGDGLELRIAGRVVDPDGRPAQGYELAVSLKTGDGELALATRADGAEFDTWVPVHGQSWIHVVLEARDEEAGLVGRRAVRVSELRRVAMEGIEVRLEPRERAVTVDVRSADGPAAGAYVRAELGGGGSYRAVADEAGRATLLLTEKEQLMQLTAWTDDLQLGGFAFYRSPSIDPRGASFGVTLEPCRPREMQLVDTASGEPVSGVTVHLSLGTGSPEWQFYGDSPDALLTSDENGRATCRWFPELATVSTTADSRTAGWQVAGDVEKEGELLRIPLQRSTPRQLVAGQIEAQIEAPGEAPGAVAGLCVIAATFQSDREGRYDRRIGFADADGVFAIEYLPDATYSMQVNDPRMVSAPVAVIPYDAATSSADPPRLEARHGVPLSVVVTFGETAEPVAAQSVSLSTSHDFSWLEDGEERWGDFGRRWSATTDAEGRATSYAGVGEEVSVSIYTPDWRGTETVTVDGEGPNVVALHRDEARTITGRVRCAVPEVAVAGTVIEIGSLDRESAETHTITVDSGGAFSLEVSAARLGLYASSPCGRAARVLVADELSEPIELELTPTVDFHGRLVDGAEQGVSSALVQAALRMRSEDETDPPFLAASFEAATDAAGAYTLAGLPTGAELRLEAAGDGIDAWLGSISVLADEQRPALVSHVGPAVASDARRSFAAIFDAQLRDGRLGHYRVMMILHDGGDEATDFTARRLLSPSWRDEVASFLQVVRVPGKAGIEDDFEATRQRYGWPLPERGSLFVAVYDEAGEEVDRLRLDPSATDAEARAAEFLRAAAPPTLDAREKWTAALELARQTDRRVWVRVSQRYCGPCFLLTSWIDDHRELLSTDYVLLKIDDVQDENGPEVAALLEARPGDGVPFHAIFDAEGELLISSRCPIMGNIGFPGSFEGQRHLRAMLTQTATRLTAEELERVVDTLVP